MPLTKRLEPELNRELGALPSCHSPVPPQVAGHRVLGSVLFQSVLNCVLGSSPGDVL